MNSIWQNFFHRYLDDLDRHHERYYRLAQQAKNQGDFEAYKTLRIQMGMLHTAEALFVKNYAAEYGVLPARKPKRQPPPKGSWPTKQNGHGVPLRAKVEHAFFQYGKLKQIPVVQKKREVVLGILAEKFEKDRIYQESEVNAVIEEIHADFCTLRRLLVDYGYLARKDGVYRRVSA